MPSISHILFATLLVFSQFWNRIEASDCQYLRESFYPSLLGPSDWYNKRGWSDSSNLDCCNWFGVVCKHDRVEQMAAEISKSAVGMILDHQQILHSYTNHHHSSLINTRISGTIPASVGSLHRLRVFGLRGNNFTGPIPNIQLVNETAHCDLGGTNKWSCKAPKVPTTCTGIGDLKTCDLMATPSDQSPTASGSATAASDSSNSLKNIIIGMSLLGGVIVIAIITLLITWRRKKRRDRSMVSFIATSRLIVGAIAQGKERMQEDPSPQQLETAQEADLQRDMDSVIGIASTSKVVPEASAPQPILDPAFNEPKHKGLLGFFMPLPFMNARNRSKSNEESMSEIPPRPSPNPQRRSIINPSFWKQRKSSSSASRNLKNKPPPIKIVPLEDLQGVNSAPTSPRTPHTKASRGSFSAPPSPKLQNKVPRIPYDPPVSPIFEKYLAEASKPVPPLTSLHISTGQVQYPKDKKWSQFKLK
ncbi:hypothetical protein K493DRAFT_378253 [Basidiobolus meristosporus CBS 931.73]|uniref:Leucine-rich repeat-containing N-terminal plant-type domain-containing protein n=1 Tax=Basidiobolus meristosporus CBS 931.73 TaxID=1314790 RepID=A0A1Y1Y160_9FUNG|nr:hypothetical protein K493DRAFT_378253 [Basidiobolus meristosporus CBS 931.73]|eukprot:ORX91708.1 hypothetical protein K493DRAFT_378253 [Basidiobolus meristosporus CBS 931.73]